MAIILIRINSNCVFSQTLHILPALVGTKVCIYISYFCHFKHPNHDFVPKESVSVSIKVRFGTQKVRFGIHESPFRSVPVRFGPFRYPLKSISVPRKSVSVSTKVRFGPFRSVPVRFGPFRSVSVRSGKS